MWQKFTNTSGSRKILAVVAVIGLLVAIPVTLSLVQSQQDIRQEAANNDDIDLRQRPIDRLLGRNRGNDDDNRGGNNKKNNKNRKNRQNNNNRNNRKHRNDLNNKKNGSEYAIACAPSTISVSQNTPATIEAQVEALDNDDEEATIIWSVNPDQLNLAAENDGETDSEGMTSLDVELNDGVASYSGIITGTVEGDPQAKCTIAVTSSNAPPPTVTITPSVSVTPSTSVTPSIIISGNTYVLPPLTFLAGDANNDKEINILDYSIMISCFNDEASCSDPLFFGSDLNDDSYVNVIDLNLYLRELARHVSS